VPRVHREIDDRALELRRIAAHAAGIPRRPDVQRDAAAERAREKRHEPVDDLSGIDVLRLGLVPPREREELLDQVRTAARGVSCSLQFPERALISATEIFGNEVEVTDQNRQQVAQVVSDAARQAPERLHSRAALHGLSEPRLLGHVDEKADERLVRRMTRPEEIALDDRTAAAEAS